MGKRQRKLCSLLYIIRRGRLMLCEFIIRMMSSSHTLALAQTTLYLTVAGIRYGNVKQGCRGQANTVLAAQHSILSVM